MRHTKIIKSSLYYQLILVMSVVLELYKLLGNYENTEVPALQCCSFAFSVSFSSSFTNFSYQILLTLRQVLGCLFYCVWVNYRKDV